MLSVYPIVTFTTRHWRLLHLEDFHVLRVWAVLGIEHLPHVLEVAISLRWEWMRIVVFFTKVGVMGYLIMNDQWPYNILEEVHVI
jgi:hypothetical protein